LRSNALLDAINALLHFWFVNYKFVTVSVNFT